MPVPEIDGGPGSSNDNRKAHEAYDDVQVLFPVHLIDLGKLRHGEIDRLGQGHVVLGMGSAG